MTGPSCWQADGRETRFITGPVAFVENLTTAYRNCGVAECVITAFFSVNQDWIQSADQSAGKIDFHLLACLLSAMGEYCVWNQIDIRG